MYTIYHNLSPMTTILMFNHQSTDWYVISTRLSLSMLHNNSLFMFVFVFFFISLVVAAYSEKKIPTKVALSGCHSVSSSPIWLDLLLASAFRRILWWARRILLIAIFIAGNFELFLRSQMLCVQFFEFDFLILYRLLVYNQWNKEEMHVAR